MLNAIDCGHLQRESMSPYVKDIAKVQMWCAWAVVNLGEATFAAVITTH